MSDQPRARLGVIKSVDWPENGFGGLSADLRARALAALRAQRFDLAEELLSNEEPGLEALVENLRIYQAELEIQNEELVQSQHQVQDALARFTSFFNTLPIAELVIDRQGLIQEANLAAQRLFNLRGTHFHQHFFARLINESDRASVIDAWGDLRPEASIVLSEVHFRARVEGDFIGDLHIASIPSLSEGTQHYVCAILDRTEEVRQRQRLRETSERLDYLAHHDALTGLPNRAYFQTRLEQCLQRARRYRRQFALLFLDLDRFKEVNDTLGHHVGDALLCRVAEILSAQIRTVDTIARLGGDEFVIILEDIPAPHFAAHFADRIMGEFSQPLEISGREFFVTLSIGISLYPGDGRERESLVQHADVAMYQTKKSGRNGFRFFEPAMSEGAIERLHLEHDLRLALQRDEFILHYQPQVDLTTGALMGVEALCRWPHPTLGMLLPSLFIPMAEELGLIDELGLKVLELGCRQMATWDAAGLYVPRLAINLSVRELERSELPGQIAEILACTGLDPKRLELEVTESKLMRQADMAIFALNAMRTLGVTLAIDDFGTGYSSLSYLKRLPLNRLKIDRSFVEGLTQDVNDDSIARAIIALAHTLGLEVLAEGIEVREQADFLFREGCVEGQGYLYDRPLMPDELAAHWLKASE
ncbi:putative bifunctional diguanylate cyclase/phosphodiesterase [Allochromatium palmeri]|uniref:cyclic-guanylate-specific phosphodiesterase n=1 Tax=Allochromatium palmeri TaxID=231048 RepID=A0A6N8E9Q7_9GAMM|nr:EAL domain-containing protein [Allochromatium palmeri]MTW20271.1 EAL domain-containing protein [Allochromatium palmeri]